MIDLRSPVLRVTVLSVLGSAVVLGGAFFAVIALWQPRSLEAFLPAERTLALLRNATREDVRAFTGQFPVLQDVPVYAGTFDVGVIALTAGKRAWVLSSRIKEQQLPSENMRIGRQTFLVSDADVQPLLESDLPRLRSSSVYMSLISEMDPTDRRAFIQKTTAPVATLPSILQPLVRSSGAVLLSIHGRTVILRTYGSVAPLPGIVSAPLPLPSPPSDVTLLLPAPDETLAQHLATLPENQQAIARGMLTKEVQGLLGADWSWTYDLLPLLQRESSVAWRTGSDGALAFLFHGTAGNWRDTEDRLTAFHTEFLSGLHGNIILARDLDKGLTSRLLRTDPSLTVDRTEESSGWTVRETGQTGGRMLLTAVRDREFLVTNDRAWLDQATSPKAIRYLPSLGGIPAAGGSLSPALVERLTAQIAPQPGWAWLLGSLETQNGVAWALGRDGQGRTLSLTLSPL
ncbi:hypothetical protein EXS70_02195 [Candidatus Peribacteria bacterium]|nr:hypothetical protein [Candidatus Peribacteria bacterium]